MTNQIEIRNCGEIRSDCLPIGRVTWEAGFTSDYAGCWHLEEDPNQFLVTRLESEVCDLKSALSDLQEDLEEAQKDAGEGARTLQSLQDEVRAFLAVSSPCKTAFARLSQALEASE